jgi:uncharacterized membrane protein HdeD (DUF308 family)
MAANVSGRYAAAPPARHTGIRVAAGVLGLAVLVTGIVLLFNPVRAAHALALLIGLGFVLAGLLEMAVGWLAGHPVTAVALGALLVIGGILAVAWPGVTLKVLVVITGLSLIVHGIARIALAVLARREVASWGLLAAAGTVNVLVGVLALAWPEATVFVLSLVVGIQVALFGLVLLAAAFAGSRPSTGAPA